MRGCSSPRTTWLAISLLTSATTARCEDTGVCALRPSTSCSRLLQRRVRSATLATVARVFGESASSTCSQCRFELRVGLSQSRVWLGTPHLLSQLGGRAWLYRCRVSLKSFRNAVSSEPVLEWVSVQLSVVRATFSTQAPQYSLMACCNIRRR